MLSRHPTITTKSLLLLLISIYSLEISGLAKTITKFDASTILQESEWLDCSPIESSGITIQNKSTCDEIIRAEPKRLTNETITPSATSSSGSSLITKTTTPTVTPAYILSIDFNNTLRRRQVLQNENCTNDHQHLQPMADVVCAAPNKNKLDSSNKAIAITIVPNDTDYELTTTASTLNLRPSSTSIIRCQFSLLPSSNVTELDFKLRWLRSVTSQHGLSNQSIASDDNGHTTIQHDHHQISVSINRVWTKQVEGGLELLLNDVKSSDSGDYFCQAIGSDNGILDEKRIHLEVAESVKDTQSRDLDSTAYSPQAEDDASNIYSVENLEKLLPSLQVIPDYSELALGESIQLACVTTGLDPDPEPDKIEWTFEPFDRPGYVPIDMDRRRGSQLTGGGGNFSDIPSNTTQLGNILIVWSMSYDTTGIYQCSYHMDDLNLTAEASGELALRPSVDSAPIVYITPELLRLSANGSAKVQCESTGYPPPLMEWYRVEVPNVTEMLKNDDERRKLLEQTGNGKGAAAEKSGSNLNHLDGLEVHQLRSQDVMAYCQQSGCRALDGLDESTRKQQQQHNELRQNRNLVTGLSWIQIGQARAHHQGQYVCKATNKHGSNQASSIVDVEFKEAPRVDIPDEHRHQTIVLDNNMDSPVTTSTRMRSVVFDCSIRAGQPMPRLKWLRANLRGRNYNKNRTDLYATANILAGHQQSSGSSSRFSSPSHATTSSDNLEIYDLTSVSSATSSVSTRFEDNSRTLRLELSTISIDDEGDYVCLGENELGRHSAVAHLVVRKSPQVRILQTSPKIFRLNDSFQLDCLVSGHPAPVDIEWSRSDKGAFFALISRHSLLLTTDQERAVLKFDRVTTDDSGEYTCAARDPINQAIILKDTIMLMAEETNLDKARGEQRTQGVDDISRQVPKLLVRPTKVTAELGSNVTLDCLAVSGLQPTIVEWLAPATAALASQPPPAGQSIEQASIRPYYRSQMMRLAQDQSQHSSSLLQFGSRLKLFNVTKAHEGVYQCKGRNKVGTENAPAFVEVLDSNNDSYNSNANTVESKLDGDTDKGGGTSATKTKIAKMGTNIELRCQVNGIVGQQPATSWSREDRELPASSVQIDHNLWIQNLTKADEGLYLCAARSSEPNEILQARIRLLVNEDGAGSGKRMGNGRFDPAILSAKIIASKTHLIEGDSVTLECVISQADVSGGASNNTGTGSSTISMDATQNSQLPELSAGDLAELERQVIWTNLHSGQSLFQDNVYIQNNLLIIYNLKSENSATYRCNYNDLTQYTDHKLQVTTSHGDSISSSQSMTGNSTTTSHLPSGRYLTGQQQQQQEFFENLPPDQQNVSQFLLNTFQTRHIVAPLASKKVLECGPQDAITGSRYFWTRHHHQQLSVRSRVGATGNESTLIKSRVGNENEPLVLDQIDTSHAGLYQCHKQLSQANGTRYKIESQYLLEVPVVAAKFVQRPVSFVTLPAVSDADHQLELELKFYPENEHGLMLFSGGVLNNNMISNNNQQQQQPASGDSSSSPMINRTLNSLNNADFISLGLVRGYLEFRFELGDGATLVRSLQPLELNRWHKVIIDRNRRGATMWLDGQDPSSNNSMGKFFNLDLDSLLYVGGHQVFLTINNSGNKRQNISTRKNISTNNSGNQINADRPSYQNRSFYGFSRGFRGCISLLKINQRELNLMARNRSVTVGIFECDKPECLVSAIKSETILDHQQKQQQFECPRSRGLCQVDRSSPPSPPSYTQQQQQVLGTGVSSSMMIPKRQQSHPTADLRCTCFPGFSGIACNENVPHPSIEDWSRNQSSGGAGLGSNQLVKALASAGNRSNSVQFSACDLSSSQCNHIGTSQCEPLSSSVYKCHCKLGFTGEHCQHVVTYMNETSVGLNQSAFIQLAFKPAQEFGPSQSSESPLSRLPTTMALNETDYARLITFTEQQNISFKIKTRASYGLLFYIGQDLGQNGISLPKIDTGSFQASKSIIANALARLSSTKVSDFLTVALVDGHIELSYELGSGLAVLRSSRRYNDAEWHKIEIARNGKASKLIIDDTLRQEAQSPGKLSMLNVGEDIYLGGLPATLQTLLSTGSSSSSGSLLSSFMGCLSDLQINSLGPINLVRSDHLTRMKSARNLVPCSDSLLSSSPQTSVSSSLSTLATSSTAGDKIAIDQELIKPPAPTEAGAAAATTTPTQATFRRTSRRPTKPSYTTTESDGDDSDELARSS